MAAKILTSGEMVNGKEGMGSGGKFEMWNIECKMLKGEVNREW
jgi:hypothetical protein